jgi:hypothetical protein
MANAKRPDPTGFEEVASSVRALAAESKAIVESAGGVAEKELARLLAAAEMSRDGILQSGALDPVRNREPFVSLKRDAHRAVDLGFDAFATLYTFATKTLEGFVDQPPQPRRPAPTS